MDDKLFYFMRKNPVDLLRYLPKFLSKDANFKNIEDVLSAEHESYRLKLVHLAKQFFLETCDEKGLADFERFLGIVPAENQSFDMRKAVARVKLRGADTLTVENTIRLMQEFMTAGEAGVEELGDYEIRLILDNATYSWDELFQALFEYLPAHLEFNFKFQNEYNQDIYVGMPEVSADIEVIDAAGVSDGQANLVVVPAIVDATCEEFYYDFTNITVNENNLSVGLILAESEYEEIKAEPPDDSFDEDFYEWIWRNWRRDKKNPVVKEYAHHFEEDEPYKPEEPEEDEIPLGDYLRLYFSFPYTMRLRTINVGNPKEPVSGREINDLGYYVTENKALLNRKGWATIGLVKAELVKRTYEKLL